jgi:hypothetical protein
LTLRRLPAPSTRKLCWLPAVPLDPGKAPAGVPCAPPRAVKARRVRWVCCAGLTMRSRGRTEPWRLQGSLARGDLVILPAFEPAESAEFDMEPDQVSFRLAASGHAQGLAHSTPKPLPARLQAVAASPGMWPVLLHSAQLACVVVRQQAARVMAAPNAAWTITSSKWSSAAADSADLLVALQTQHLPPQDVVRWGIADIAEGLAVQAEAISGGQCCCRMYRIRRSAPPMHSLFGTTKPARCVVMLAELRLRRC